MAHRPIRQRRIRGAVTQISASAGTTTAVFCCGTAILTQTSRHPEQLGRTARHTQRAAQIDGKDGIATNPLYTIQSTRLPIAEEAKRQVAWQPDRASARAGPQPNDELRESWRRQTVDVARSSTPPDAVPASPRPMYLSTSTTRRTTMETLSPGGSPGLRLGPFVEDVRSYRAWSTGAGNTKVAAETARNARKHDSRRVGDSRRGTAEDLPIE